MVSHQCFLNLLQSARLESCLPVLPAAHVRAADRAWRVASLPWPDAVASFSADYHGTRCTSDVRMFHARRSNRSFIAYSPPMDGRSLRVRAWMQVTRRWAESGDEGRSAVPVAPICRQKSAKGPVYRAFWQLLRIPIPLRFVTLCNTFASC